MSDPLPMFDDPIPPAEPKPPKKPRQKPVRKARKLAAPKPVPKKRRIKRAAKVWRVGPAKDKHAGGRYSKDVYAVIAKLVSMESAEREFVNDVVKALTHGRAD